MLITYVALTVFLVSFFLMTIIAVRHTCMLWHRTDMARARLIRRARHTYSFPIYDNNHPKFCRAHKCVNAPTVDFFGHHFCQEHMERHLHEISIDARVDC